MATRPPYTATVALLAMATLIGVGCATQRISAPPPSSAAQTHEQGTETEQEATATDGSSSSGGEAGGEGAGQSGEGSDGSPSSNGSEQSDTGEGVGEKSSAGGARTPEALGSGGDRELAKSLREFEELLAQEREQLASDATNDASGSGGREGSQSGEAGAGEQDPQGASEEQGRGAANTAGAADDPPGIPDGHDDDVVARQLRELAENETDPEKRALYWQDYLDYKSGRRKSPAPGKETPEAAAEDDEE